MSRLNEGKLRGRLLVFALAMCLGAVLAVVPGTAATAGGCWGTSCAGRNPHSQGCDGSGEVSEIGGRIWFNGNITVFSLALRHSSDCNARWARMVVDAWLGPGGHPDLQFRVMRRYYTLGNWYTSHIYRKTVDPPSTGNFWTAMVPNAGTDQHRVCWRYAANPGQSPREWNCTGWRS